MLSKRQKKGILIGIVVIVGGLLLLYATFISPNFYEQVQRRKHDVITDVTMEEREIIEENILFTLPKSAKIDKISAPIQLMEPGFYMTFSIPLKEREDFIQSLAEDYRHTEETSEWFPIEVAGKSYLPIAHYERISYMYTGIYEYQEINQQVYFQFHYTDYPDELSDIFYERIRILPDWLVGK